MPPVAFMHGAPFIKSQAATYQCTKHPLRTRRDAYQNRLKCTMNKKVPTHAELKYTQGTPPHPGGSKKKAHGMALKYTPAQPTATAGKTRWQISPIGNARRICGQNQLRLTIPAVLSVKDVDATIGTLRVSV